MRGKKKKSTGGIKQSEKLIKNDSFFLYKMINHGYWLFNIVRTFTKRQLWNLSCFGFLFLVPFMFEVLSEQEAVLDKIQRDDMLAQAADLGGYNPAEASQPIVRPF